MIPIPRTTAMILLAVGALGVAGCSSTEGGTAITGSGPRSSIQVTSGIRSSPDTRSAASHSTPATSSPNAPLPSAPAVLTDPASSRPSTTAAPSARPTTPRSTRPSPTTSSSTSARTIPRRSSTPAVASFPVCPTVPATDIPGIVNCLKTSVSDFWSAELNEVVDQDVIVDPTTAQVPTDCRGGLTAAPAFTCQVNDTVYINQSFLDEVRKDFGAGDIPYALASVVSHEIGHVVQAAVKQPGYDQTGSSNTISQQIEQQADCLSGVWALSQVKLGRLDTTVFETVAKQLITDVSTNPEIYTHGTPDQRAAAILLGLSTGTPQGCKLNTFS